MKSYLMATRKAKVLLALGVLTATLLSGCIVGGSRHRDAASVPGVVVDRKFVVTGPIRLELTTNDGEARVIAGQSGQVEIHAEFRARARLFHDSERRLNEMAENPPISQEGNFVRIGGIGSHNGSIVADYTIAVPPDTDIHAMTGSGNIEVSGIKGPANFTGGSGNITASNIGSDVQAIVGSGTIRLSDVQGMVQATAGSGNIQLFEIRGDVRAQAGSGDIQIAKPIGAVEASTGSGNINLTSISADLRLQTSSGNVIVDGNPQSSSFWEMHSSSGTVTLRVPPDANFRLYAKTSSGDIDTQIPITMEGTTGKHDLRARIGDGKARVEIETNSGKILLR